VEDILLLNKFFPILDIVLDGHPVPPKKGATAALPTFRPMPIVAKRLDFSRCHLVPRLGPRHIVLRGDPVPPPKKKEHSSPPQFLADVL